MLSFLYTPTLTFIHDYWRNHSFDYTDICRQSNVSAFQYTVQVCRRFSSKEPTSFNFTEKCREQDSYLSGQTPLDFESNALTTQPSQLYFQIPLLKSNCQQQIFPFPQLCFKIQLLLMSNNQIKQADRIIRIGSNPTDELHRPSHVLQHLQHVILYDI